MLKNLGEEYLSEKKVLEETLEVFEENKTLDKVEPNKTKLSKSVRFAEDKNTIIHEYPKEDSYDETPGSTITDSTITSIDPEKVTKSRNGSKG